MESSPRNVAVVACYIASVLPIDQTKFKDEIMEYVMNDLSYKSPETLTHADTWQLFEIIMKKYIQKFDEPWKKEIVDIYIGKTKIPDNPFKNTLELE